ncbi:MAG: DNA polymerase III subunit delta [Candidatus Aminicenantes bacterium]|nr:DNA polymerase III subunit delta [Candidatus Aminicenantes bacterium]
MLRQTSWQQNLKLLVSFDALKPGNFFFGEQALLVRNYVKELVRHNEEVQLKIFFLHETDWPAILDEAATLDLFSLSQRRIFLIYLPELDEVDSQSVDRAFRQYLSPYKDEIARYFQAPADNVFLIILFAGKLKKGQKIYDFFSDLAARSRKNFRLEEIKTPREAEILSWIRECLLEKGKTIEKSAAERLLEITRPDLLNLMNEMEKLSLFVGDKKSISEEDVIRSCAGQKVFDRFALEEALESGSLEQALAITRSFFQNRPEAGEVMAFFASISRYIIALNQAKTEVERLKEPIRDVFKKLHPQIQEGWSLFDRKLEAFSRRLRSFSQKQLDELVHELASIDQKIKSSDLNPQFLIEAFLVRYFQVKNSQS